MDDCIIATQNAIDKVAKIIDYCMEHLLMEILINLVIFLNTIAIAIRQPDTSGDLKNVIIQADFYARWIFTAEIVLRILGKGFILQKQAFLRTGWGIFDTAIVVSRWIDMVYPFGNLLFLRMLRLYKMIFQKEDDPFAKRIDVFKISQQEWFITSKVLVETVAKSSTQVIQVVVLLLFTMLLAGVFGINVIGSVLTNRCAYEDLNGGSTSAYTDTPNKNYTLSVPTMACHGGNTCPNFQSVRTSSTTYFPGHLGTQTCVNLGELPSTGHFCDIGGAAVLVFQAYYTDSWSVGMFWSIDALHPAIVALFIFLVIFGAFYLMSLTVATTALQYGQLALIYQNKIDLIRKEEQRLKDEAEGKHEAGGGDDDQDGSDSDDDGGGNIKLTAWGEKMEKELELIEQIKEQETGGGFTACKTFLTVCFNGFLVCYGFCINKVIICCTCPIDAAKIQNSKFVTELPGAYKRMADKLTDLIYWRPLERKTADGTEPQPSKLTYLDIGNTANVILWFATLAANSDSVNKNLGFILFALVLIQTALFIGLVIVKYIGHQNLVFYVTQPSNILDVLVVAATVIGVVFTQFGILDSSDPTMNGLMLLHLAPVAWLLYRLELPGVMVRVLKNPPAIVAAIFMLLFMIFIFALLGIELFHAVSFRNDSDFSSFPTAIHLLMEIMMGDGWTTYSLEGRRTLGFVGYTYFLCYFYICNFMFLRLFIAIIIYNFELSDEEKIVGQKLIWDQKMEKTEEKFRERFNQPVKFDLVEQYKMLQAPTISTKDLNDHKAKLDKEAEAEINKKLENKRKVELAKEKEINEKEAARLAGDKRKVIKYEHPIPDMDEETVVRHLSIINLERQGAVVESRLQQVRRLMRRFADSQPFTFFVLLVVLLSTVLAVINTPGEDPILPKDLEKIFDFAFMGVFGLEAVIKILSYGRHPFSTPIKAGEEPGYFRRSWDSFDWLIIMFQVLDLLVSNGVILDADDPSIAWLKGLRALRIVRVIPRLMKFGRKEGEQNPIRIATAALGASLPEIGIVLLSLLLFMFFCSLIGMDLYMTFLYKCNDTDASIVTKDNCKGVYTNFPDSWTDVARGVDYSYPSPRAWQKPDTNFDNILNSMKTLFMVLNRGGLSDITRSLMAITVFDGQPRPNNRMVNLTFVMFFQILGGIFVSQMVIGIIVNNLRLKSGSGLYTTLQRQWKATQLMIDSMEGPKMRARDNEERVTGLAGIRQAMKKISTHPYYEYFMTLIVLINCGFLAAAHCNESDAEQQFFYFSDLIFLALYIVEIIFKGVTSPEIYFFNTDDLSDIFITVIGAIQIGLDQALNINVGLGVLKLFRLLRVLRRSDQMQQQLRTITSSLGGIAAATFLLIVWIFMFSAVGTRTYGRVGYGNEIRAQKNFKSMPSSMLMLFELAAGESWNAVMFDASVTAPYCTETLPAVGTPERTAFAPNAYVNALGDCGTGPAWVFFFIFILGVNYILLPLYIASVITFFYETNSRVFSRIKLEDVRKYKDTWAEFFGGGTKVFPNKDPVADKMPFSQLRPFLETLKLAGCELGCRKNGPVREREAFKRIEKQCRLAGQAFLWAERKDLGDKDPFENESIFVDYYELIVYLAANLFEKAAVTVVDIMFQEKSRKVLEDAAWWPEHKLMADARPKTLKDFMYSMQRREARQDDDSESVDSNHEYIASKKQLSFNLYSILADAAQSHADGEDGLELDHYKRLLLLVRENDEKLFVLFEEYSEDPSTENLARFISGVRELVEGWTSNDLAGRRDTGASISAGAVVAVIAEPGADDFEEPAAPMLEITNGMGAMSVVPGIPIEAPSGDDEHSDALVPSGSRDVVDMSKIVPCPNCGEGVQVDWEYCPNKTCRMPLNFDGAGGMYDGVDGDNPDEPAPPQTQAGAAFLPGMPSFNFSSVANIMHSAQEKFSNALGPEPAPVVDLDEEERGEDFGHVDVNSIGHKRSEGQSRRRNRI